MYGMIALRPLFRGGCSRFRVMHQREAVLSMTLLCKRDCLGASLSCFVSSNVLRELLLGFERHPRSKRWLSMYSQRTANHLLQPRYRRRHAYLWHEKDSSDCCRTVASSSSSSALCLRRPEGQCSTTGSRFLHAIKHSYHSTYFQGTDAGLLQKLDALLGQNEPEHALMHAFEQMNVKLNTELVCDVLRHQQDLDMAYRFFSLTAKKEGYEHSPVVYNLLLSKLALAKPKVAYELVLEMINSIGCSPEGMVLDLVLEGLGIAGLVDEAFILIGTLGAQGSSVNFNALIKGLESVSRYDEAFAVFYGAKTQECNINPATYMQVLLLHLKLGQSKEAYHLLTETKRKGFRYDRLIYDSLIDSFCRKDDVNRALQVFGEMKSMDYIPAMSSYCRLVLSLCSVGQLQDASELLKEAEEKYGSFDAAYYSDLIAGLGKASQLDYALGLLGHMKSISLSPSSLAYSTVINGLCKAGRLETACNLFCEMEDKFPTSDACTYATLIVSLAKTDQPDKATKFFERMKAKGFTPTLNVYSSLVRCLQYAGQLADAYELFREMRMKGFRPHPDLYNRMIVSLVKGKRLEEVFHLFGDMKTVNCIPNTLACNAVLKMLATTHEIEKFQSFYKDLRERGCHFDGITSNILLDFFSMMGNLDEARVLMNELQVKGHVVDPTKLSSELCKGSETHLLADNSSKAGS